jgi:hypothetical protein
VAQEIETQLRVQLLNLPQREGQEEAAAAGEEAPAETPVEG